MKVYIIDYGNIPIHIAGCKSILNNDFCMLSELLEIFDDKELEELDGSYCTEEQNNVTICAYIDLRKYIPVNYGSLTLGGFLLYYNNDITHKDTKYSRYSIINTDNSSFPERYRNRECNSISLFADLVRNNEIDLLESDIEIKDTYMTADEIVEDMDLIKTDNAIFATYILKDICINDNIATTKYQSIEFLVY